MHRDEVAGGHRVVGTYGDQAGGDQGVDLDGLVEALTAGLATTGGSR